MHVLISLYSNCVLISLRANYVLIRDNVLIVLSLGFPKLPFTKRLTAVVLFLLFFSVLMGMHEGWFATCTDTQYSLYVAAFFEVNYYQDPAANHADVAWSRKRQRSKTKYVFVPSSHI